MKKGHSFYNKVYLSSYSHNFWMIPSHKYRKSLHDLLAKHLEFGNKLEPTRPLLFWESHQMGWPNLTMKTHYINQRQQEMFTNKSAIPPSCVAIPPNHEVALCCFRFRLYRLFSGWNRCRSSKQSRSIPREPSIT